MKLIRYSLEYIPRIGGACRIRKELTGELNFGVMRWLNNKVLMVNTTGTEIAKLIKSY